MLRNYFHFSLPEIPEYLEHIMHAPTLLVLLVFLAKLYFYEGIFQGQLLKVIGCVIIADSITTICYVLFKYYPVSKKYICRGFATTGLLFLSVYFLPQKIVGLSYFNAAIIGLAQGLAFLPGISRLGITFVIGCWLGLAPLESIAYSCAIQLPLICGALVKSVLEIVVHKAPPITLSLIDYILLALSTLFAYLMLMMIANHLENFHVLEFGLYLLVVGLIGAGVKFFGHGLVN